MNRIVHGLLFVVLMFCGLALTGCADDMTWYNPTTWYESSDEEATDESEELDEAEKAIENAETEAEEFKTAKDKAKSQLDDVDTANKAEADRAKELRERYEKIGK